MMACALAVFAVMAPAAAADSLELDLPQTATEGQAVEVLADGEVDAPRRLYAYLRPSGACAATAQDEALSGAASLFGDFLSGIPIEDDFEQEASVTPAAPGTYNVCAYTADAGTAPPSASATETLVVEAASATLDATIGEAIRGRPVAITLSGESGSPSTLFSYWLDYDEPCEATAADAADAAAALGKPQAVHGAFSATYEVTPEDAGAARLCAYVADGPTATPRVARSVAATVRDAAAAVELGAVPGTAKVGDTLTVIATGTTDGPGYAATELLEGTSKCLAEEVDEPQPVAAGPFSVEEPHTVEASGPSTVCAYVLDEDDEILASARAVLRVTGPNGAAGAKGPKGDGPGETTAGRARFRAKAARRYMRRTIKRRFHVTVRRFTACRRATYRLRCHVGFRTRRGKRFAGTITAFSVLDGGREKLHASYRIKRRH
jgi:hypothetical protein